MFQQYDWNMDYRYVHLLFNIYVEANIGLGEIAASSQFRDDDWLPPSPHKHIYSL